MTKPQAFKAMKQAIASESRLSREGLHSF